MPIEQIGLAMLDTCQVSPFCAWCLLQEMGELHWQPVTVEHV